MWQRQLSKGQEQHSRRAICFSWLEISQASVPQALIDFGRFVTIRDFYMGKKLKPITVVCRLFEHDGCIGGRVDRQVRPNVSLDWCGWADAIYMDKHGAVIGVQATDLTSHSKRRRKVLENDRAQKWALHGHKIAIISVCAKTARIREEWLTIVDFAEYEAIG